MYTCLYSLYSHFKVWYSTPARHGDGDGGVGGDGVEGDVGVGGAHGVHGDVGG